MRIVRRCTICILMQINQKLTKKLYLFIDSTSSRLFLTVKFDQLIGVESESDWHFWETRFLESVDGVVRKPVDGDAETVEDASQFVNVRR